MSTHKYTAVTAKIAWRIAEYSLFVYLGIVLSILGIDWLDGRFWATMIPAAVLNELSYSARRREV